MATILLVDDDPLPAHLRKAALERRFHEVRRVSDTSDALCLIEQPAFARNLTLVILAQHRSGIAGTALVSELQARMPDLPILVLDDASENSGDYGGEHVQFMLRPFSDDALLELASQMQALGWKKTA